MRRQARVFCRGHDDYFWHLNPPRRYRGWAKVEIGGLREGVSFFLGRGSSAYRATGAVMWVFHHIARLARACEIAGQAEEALAQLEDGFQMVERTGERWLEAEGKVGDRSSLQIRLPALKPSETNNVALVRFDPDA
jgi:hypothetical protein